ncbi:hypothetical protein EK904_007681 [Melospiza melodia maxima]|nr:hypothetical protein EK904_007681 [Melospiza melodia maxima]
MHFQGEFPAMEIRAAELPKKEEELCKEQEEEEETHLDGERNVPETQKSESKSYAAPQELSWPFKCAQKRDGLL